MSFLLYLSNELLHNICVFLDPEVWVEFSVTCRRIYLVSKELKAQHHAAWKKFSSFEDDETTHPWFWHNLAAYLLGESKGAEYVHHLKMGVVEARMIGIPSEPYRGIYVKDWDVETGRRISVRYTPPRRGDRGIQRANQNLFLRDLGPFRRAIGELHYTSEEQKHVTIDRVKGGVIGPTGGFAQLDLQGIFQQASISPTLDTPHHSFSKLHTIELGSMTSDLAYDGLGPRNRESYSLPFLAAVAGLPKMRKISAVGVVAESFSRIPSLPAPRITEFIISNSDISAAAFANFFDGGAPLRLVDVDVCMHSSHFVESEFGEVLFANAGGSLEELRISRESITGATTGIDLYSFRKLKKVNISYQSLHINSKIPLSKVLPASLEHLNVHVLQYQASLGPELTALVRQKSELFGALEKKAAMFAVTMICPIRDSHSILFAHTGCPILPRICLRGGGYDSDDGYEAYYERDDEPDEESDADFYQLEDDFADDDTAVDDDTAAEEEEGVQSDADSEIIIG
ncbi:hypothetical protein B0J14DRAFT_662213 [Halenospora varia]|nr:hypothetical protein B0J14DRAFT_662213 [Halenospora varia]